MSYRFTCINLCESSILQVSCKPHMTILGATGRHKLFTLANTFQQKHMLAVRSLSAPHTAILWGVRLRQKNLNLKVPFLYLVPNDHLKISKHLDMLEFQFSANTRSQCDKSQAINKYRSAGHSLNEYLNTNAFGENVWGKLIIQKPTKIAHAEEMGTQTDKCNSEELSDVIKVTQAEDKQAISMGRTNTQLPGPTCGYKM